MIAPHDDHESSHETQDNRTMVKPKTVLELRTTNHNNNRSIMFLQQQTISIEEGGMGVQKPNNRSMDLP